MPTQYEVALVLSAKNLASAALAVVEGDLKKVEDRLGTTTKTAQKLPNIFAGIASGAAGLARGLGTLGLAKQGLDTLAGAAAGLGGVLGVGVASQMETVTAQFNAFTKDGATTAKILARVRDEADKTPFAFAEMAQAAAMLLPASKTARGGLEGLIKEAEILAALNPAEGLEGAAFSLREALSGDFVSVMERFNIPRELINRLKDEGVPNAEIVGRALAEMGADFSLVSNLAGTTGGRLSTFQDSLGRLQQVAGEPILAALGGALDELSGIVADNQAALTALAGDIGTALAGAIKAGVQLFKEWLPRIRDAFEALGVLRERAAGVLDAVGPVAKTLAENLLPVLGTVARLIKENLQPILITLAAALGTGLVASIVGAVLSFGAILLALNPVTLALGALLAAVFLLAKAWTENWGDIQGKTAAAWAFLGPILAGLGDALRLLLEGLLPALSAAFTVAWEAIGAVVGTVWGFLSTVIFPPLMEALGWFTVVLLPELTATWDAISNKITEVWNWLWPNLLKPGLAELARLWSENWEAARAVLAAVWAVIQTTIEVAWPIIQGIILAGVKLVRGDWEGAWEAIETGFRTAWEEIQKTLGTLVAGVLAVLQQLAEDAGRAALDVGKAIFEGILNGVKDLASALKDAVGSAIRGALEAAADAIRNWRPPAIPMPSFSLPGRGGGDLAGDLPPISPGVLGRPLSGPITQEYGQTPFSRAHPEFYGSRGHDGIDIAAPKGTPVGSAGQGRVTRAGFDPTGYGNLVEVVHNGISTFYGHLDAIRVAIGERLTPGQTLGTVGLTGNTTGAHLHLGARDHGRSIDPRSVIAFATGGLIREPVVGVGKSGRLYTLGENESEQTAVVPNSAFRRPGSRPGSPVPGEAPSGGDVHHHYHLTFTGAVFGRDVEDVVVEAIVGAQRRGRLA